MARAHRNITKQEVEEIVLVEKEVDEGIVLYLTPDEANTLLTILGNVGGTGTKEKRHVGDIWFALSSNGAEYLGRELLEGNLYIRSLKDRDGFK